jgi:hypothetical protein
MSGVVGNRWFSLSVRRNFRNPFKDWLIGSLAPTAGGTNVDMWVLVHPFGLVVLLIIGLVALQTGKVEPVGAASVLGVVVVGRILALGEAATLIGFVAEVLRVDHPPVGQPAEPTHRVSSEAGPDSAPH